MKSLVFLMVLMLGTFAHANLTGLYQGEFDRNDWHCQAQMDLQQTKSPMTYGRT